MIHQQEKLELLTMQKDIANDLIENKLFSRQWIYDNIFDLNDQEKVEAVQEACQQFIHRYGGFGQR